MQSTILKLLLLNILAITQLIYSQTMWNKTFGGQNYDLPVSVVETFDSGYIIIGDSQSFGPGKNVWFIRLNSVGDTLWTKTYGNSDLFYMPSYMKVIGNEYFVCGTMVDTSDENGYYDGFLMKTDEYGNLIWNKRYDTSLESWLHSMDKTLDNGYILAGSSGLALQDTVAMDSWLIKTDSKGDTIWTKLYSMWHDYMDWTSGWFRVIDDIVYQLPDGGFTIGGTTKYPCGTYYNAWLIKTDSLGNKKWAKFYGNEHTWLSDYKITVDGGYIITLSFDAKALLLKTDINGDSVWVKDYAHNIGDYISSVVQTDDKGFIFDVDTYGTNDSKLIKVDSVGTIMWEKTYLESYPCQITSISQTSDGGYILLGTMEYSQRNHDIWIVKTDSIGNSTELTSIRQRIAKAKEFVLQQNYPNPFNPKTIINYELRITNYVNLSVYNLLGQKVAKLVNKKQTAGSYQVEWDASGFATGLYLYRLSAGDFTEIRKMVLMK